MLSAVFLWALGTGAVTGAVWVGIVLAGRQRRLLEQNRELLEDRQRSLDALDAVHRRVLEVEERLDFSQRLLAERRDFTPAPPPPVDEN